MDDSKIIGIIALVMSVGGSIIAVINHKKSRCGLCGKKFEVSVDIENTTPQQSSRRPSIILSQPEPPIKIQSP